MIKLAHAHEGHAVEHVLLGELPTEWLIIIGLAVLVFLAAGVLWWRRSR